MSDRAGVALEDFLRGARPIAEVEQEIRDAVARDPRLVVPLLDKLDLLLQAGRLPPAPYAALAAAARYDGPPGVDVNAATRPQREPPARAFDSAPDAAPVTRAAFTRIDPDVARQGADATRPVQAEAEPTRDAWSRVPPEEERAPPTAALDNGSRADPAPATVAPEAVAPSVRSVGPTGSNWEHPEQWRSRHDGIVGPGSVVGKFKIENEIGRGGMGVVYRAIDLLKQEAEDRNPYVAVKILNDEFRRHPKALVALQREASKAQQLAHPNVITVHDFGRDGTTIYLTMELLKGEPLSRLLARHRGRGVAKDQARSLINGMAQALGYAHEQGIAHCDFKPGNVFVLEGGKAKVLDFGIARAVPTQLQPNADHTVFDAADLGALTPPYASPEMLNGSPATPRDDVFALGIVAFELLAGEHPFDRVPANELPANLRPKMPAGLSRRQRRALTRALDFDREARQEDARAFLAEFEGPKAVAIAAYSTAAVSAVVAGIAIVHAMQLRPDIPFDELPLADQQRFNAAIEEGRKALEFGDLALSDAFLYYADAFDLHRNNDRAIAGLETVADRYLAGMRETDSDNQEDVLKKLYCQEYLSRYRPVLRACRSVLGTDCSPARLACPNATEMDSN